MAEPRYVANTKPDYVPPVSGAAAPGGTSTSVGSSSSSSSSSGSDTGTVGGSGVRKRGAASGCGCCSRNNAVMAVAAPTASTRPVVVAGEWPGEKAVIAKVEATVAEVLATAESAPRRAGGSIYSGEGGNALLLFRAAQFARKLGASADSKTPEDGAVAAMRLPSADKLLAGAVTVLRRVAVPPSVRGVGSRVTFLEGAVGAWALLAVCYHQMGDARSSAEAVQMLLKFAPRCFEAQSARDDDVPYEVLYGRSGYLYACLFVNHYITGAVPSDTIKRIVNAIIAHGTANRTRSCPLMYEWHDSAYLGAAHGLVGICHMLLQTGIPEGRTSAVQGTIESVAFRNMTRAGNITSQYGGNHDHLIQWCHGAGGAVLTFCLAYSIFKSEHLLKATETAANTVWERGVLTKGVGLCHGIGGNGYAFLAMYRVTRDPKWLHRARQFAELVVEWRRRPSDSARDADDDADEDDYDKSPFNSAVGGCMYLLDVLQPFAARFPGYDV